MYKFGVLLCRLVLDRKLSTVKMEVITIYYAFRTCVDCNQEELFNLTKIVRSSLKPSSSQLTTNNEIRLVKKELLTATNMVDNFC